jgi:hypothetical protein
MFQPLQDHLQGARNLHLLYINCLCLLLCKVNVHYEPPEDGLVRAETCVGVEE